MKAFWLALLALLVVHRMMRLQAPAVQRTAQEAKAWADWFVMHPNGGGV